MNERKYLFLDGKEERQALIREIHLIRNRIIELVESLPESKWYETRYYGLTPAALLGHLNLMDRGGLWALKAALVNLRVPISEKRLQKINQITGRLFEHRIVSTSIQDIRRTEANITDLILNLPMDQFTKDVFHPALGKRLIIEQAVQAFFLHHWQDHLLIIEGVEEGVFYEPPNEPPSNTML